MLAEGIGRQLRDQRHDETAQLFAYAQLLLAVGDGDARYGTTGTTPKFWAPWREEVSATRNRPRGKTDRSLPMCRPHCCATNRWRSPTTSRASGRSHRYRPAQDRLLAALLQPDRLLEFLRLFVLFDRKVGEVVACYPQFFGIRAVLARIQQRRPDGAARGRGGAAHDRLGRAFHDGVSDQGAGAAPVDAGLPGAGRHGPDRPRKPARAQLQDQRRVRPGHRDEEGGREGQGGRRARGAPASAVDLAAARCLARASHACAAVHAREREEERLYLGRRHALKVLAAVLTRLYCISDSSYRVRA